MTEGMVTLLICLRKVAGSKPNKDGNYNWRGMGFNCTI